MKGDKTPPPKTPIPDTGKPCEIKSHVIDEILSKLDQPQEKFNEPKREN